MVELVCTIAIMGVLACVLMGVLCGVKWKMKRKIERTYNHHNDIVNTLLIDPYDVDATYSGSIRWERAIDNWASNQ